VGTLSTDKQPTGLSLRLCLRDLVCGSARRAWQISNRWGTIPPKADQRKSIRQTQVKRSPASMLNSNLKMKASVPSQLSGLNTKKQFDDFELLLDSAQINVMKNRELLSNIRKSSPIKLYGLNDTEDGISCDTVGDLLDSERHTFVKLRKRICCQLLRYEAIAGLSTLTMRRMNLLFLTKIQRDSFFLNETISIGAMLGGKMLSVCQRRRSIH
jgi:hypothetical protein